MALHVRIAPCLLNEPAQGALDCTVRSGPGSPVLAVKRVKKAESYTCVVHVERLAGDGSHFP